MSEVANEEPANEEVTGEQVRSGEQDKTVESCKFLEGCGFFKKYKATKDLACRGFIRLYCQGRKQDQCKRKQYFTEHGVPPEDDMMPSGHVILDDEKSLPTNSNGNDRAAD
jgi:hypothetical protein